MGPFSGRSVLWPRLFRGSAATGMAVRGAEPGLSPEQIACGLIFQGLLVMGNIWPSFSVLSICRQKSNSSIKITFEQGLEATVKDH